MKADPERERAPTAEGEDRVVVDRENSMIEGEDPRSRDGGGGGGGGEGGCSAVAPWSGNITAENAYQGFHGGMTSGPVANVNVNNEQLVSLLSLVTESNWLRFILNGVWICMDRSSLAPYCSKVVVRIAYGVWFL